MPPKINTIPSGIRPGATKEIPAIRIEGYKVLVGVGADESRIVAGVKGAATIACQQISSPTNVMPLWRLKSNTMVKGETEKMMGRKSVFILGLPSQTLSIVLRPSIYLNYS